MRPGKPSDRPGFVVTAIIGLIVLIGSIAEDLAEGFGLAPMVVFITACIIGFVWLFCRKAKRADNQKAGDEYAKQGYVKDA